MSEAERDRMRTELDRFSRRLDARTREFKQSGEFPDVHQSLMIQIQRRRNRIQSKLDAAEANGTAWDVMKIELERDFRSIFDGLLQLEENFDADVMKQHQD